MLTCLTSVGPLLWLHKLDGKGYVTTEIRTGGLSDPLMYDSAKNQWSSLSALRYVRFSLVTVPGRKRLLAIGGEGINKGVNEVTYVFIRIIL